MKTKLFALLFALLFLLWSVAGICASSVILAWDPNPEPDIAGYRIYWGVASGAYTNNISVTNSVGMSTNNPSGIDTTVTVSNLVDGVTYYFAATAYNTSSLESDFSNEISFTTSPKYAVTNLAFVTVTTNSSTIGWTVIDTDRLVGFKVLAGTQTGTYGITNVVLNPFATEATVSGLTPNVRYFFAVKTLYGSSTNYVDGPISQEIAYGNRPQAPVIVELQLVP